MINIFHSGILLAFDPRSVGGCDAGISCFKIILWSDRFHLIGRSEMFFVIRRPVTDDDLAGVFVRHDDGSDGESASLGVWVVCLQWLSHHASMVKTLVRESGSHQTFDLARPI